MQTDFQIGSGQKGVSTVRPLHEADAVTLEVLLQACFKKLGCMGESIKIKVIYDYSRIFIRFDQGICRTLHFSGVAQAPEKAAAEGRLSCAEVADQIDRQARRQGVSQPFAHGQGGIFIEQVHGGGRTAIINRMSLGHDNLSGRQDELASLAANIRTWGLELGFDEVGIADTDLRDVEPGLQAWLDAGCHGQMDYMYKHGLKRTRPEELVPGTRRVVSVRMSYLGGGESPAAVLGDAGKAYVSRYALGRDYHKVLRSRLQRLADRISAEAPHGYRVFVDSAPVMEVALAGKAGLGWRGKHTLLLSRQAGSFFFLGEIYTDLPLPVDAAVSAHCGDCSACIPACPTGAIVAPYKVDARRCISYLTIELKDAIPEEFRPLIGNRIYGCDDCQLVCPWNRFARQSTVSDFTPRHGLDGAGLVELFLWSKVIFEERMTGSPIYRIGYERWSRNIAVALGNAIGVPMAVAALESRRNDPSPMVREHVMWALRQHHIPRPEAAV